MMMETNCSSVRAADRKTALKTWIKARMMLRVGLPFKAY